MDQIGPERTGRPGPGVGAWAARPRRITIYRRTGVCRRAVCRGSELPMAIDATVEGGGGPYSAGPGPGSAVGMWPVHILCVGVVPPATACLMMVDPGHRFIERVHNLHPLSRILF